MIALIYFFVALNDMVQLNIPLFQVDVWALGVTAIEMAEVYLPSAYFVLQLTGKI